MEKPYSLEELKNKALKKGLPEVEQLAEKLYEAVREWVKESAMASPNPYDDLGIPFLSQVDGFVKPQMDKIDGEEG